MNMAVIFGGRSVEHDVSIVTGLQWIENASQQYTIIPIYITRNGNWYTGDRLLDVDFLRNFDENTKGVYAAFIPPDSGKKELQVFEKGLFGNRVRSVEIDVAVLAMHGMNGEDGTLQGLLELADIPYTSAGVLGSAVGMDKIAAKAFFTGNNFPVLEYVWITRDEWAKHKEEALDKIEAALPYPVFVKPSNLGSSIGINKGKDRATLSDAIDVAVHYDRRIIIERGVESLIEINCSAMGFGDEVQASLCEQPIAWQEFLTYEDKYLQGGKGKTSGAGEGMASLSRQIPADIPEALTKAIQQLTTDVFRSLDCKGVVRIDYIYDTQNEKLYINEINSIPGSFAFYLWEPLGISYTMLIDKLVEYARRANAEKGLNTYAFDSAILQNYKKSSKLRK